jgi:hypothetical protein
MLKMCRVSLFEVKIRTLFEERGSNAERTWPFLIFSTSHEEQRTETLGISGCAKSHLHVATEVFSWQ